MKKAVLLTAILSAAAGLSAAPATNPVLDLFENDIIFSLNFDDGTMNADMANGKGEPKKIETKPEFTEKGLFGKALVKGWAHYDAVQNIDLTIPGSLVYWVAPTGWPTKRPANGKEPGYTALQIRGRSDSYNYTMISGKMYGQPWRHGIFNTYVQYPGAKIKHVNCLAYGKAAAQGWKNGVWKMVAVTWGGGKFNIYINGEPMRPSSLKKLMTGKMVFMQLGVRGLVKVDEYTIFNRPLTDAELKKLYDAVIKARGGVN